MHRCASAQWRLKQPAGSARLALVLRSLELSVRHDAILRQMAWLWRDAMRWLLCPRCVRRPVLATCAFALSRVEWRLAPLHSRGSRTWLCCS
eukprot:scaffold1703_cov68-Phaeocystis_antarctica.AAC.2